MSGLDRCARPLLCAAAILTATGWLAGCQAPGEYRKEADDTAYRLLARAQQEVLGRTEPFSIEQPADALRRRLLRGQDLPVATPTTFGTKYLSPIMGWPDAEYFNEASTGSVPPIEQSHRLTLLAALQVGARNSREYQNRKEQVFQAALDLDLEHEAFRNSWTGILNPGLVAELDATGSAIGTESSGTLSLARTFKSGAKFATRLIVDLVKLLTLDRASSLGLFADATVTIPLLRGSGAFVVTEPLTQAQRDVVYAIYEFERFKRVFTVQAASGYLGVLQALDEFRNAEDNYRWLIVATQRARRLAAAGRLPELQVDQAHQNELRARNRWVLARNVSERSLDSFKALLGLPTDATLELDSEELAQMDRVARQTLKLDAVDPPGAPSVAEADAPVELIPPDLAGSAALGMDSRTAIELALAQRLDLRAAIGRISDAQRGVMVAADALRADLTLLGRGAIGQRRTLASAGSPNAGLNPSRGTYSALLTVDLPLERTAERNAYRSRLIALEKSVRDLQALEDEIKLAVRDGLRKVLGAREGLRIQARALRLAQRRVDGTTLFLEAGRGEIRDLLDAQEDLLSAQDALTAALVGYRVAELELQRDLGGLEIDEHGVYRVGPKGKDVRADVQRGPAAATVNVRDARVTESESSRPLGPYVATENVRYRTGPDTRHRALGTLAAGTPVQVSSVEQGWLRVAIAGGGYAYAHGDFFRLEAEVSAPVAGESAARRLATSQVAKRHVAIANVHYRTGAGINYATKGLMLAGAEVRVTGVEGEWFRIALGGDVDAFVDRRFLRTISSSQRERTARWLGTFIAGTNVVYRTGPGTEFERRGVIAARSLVSAVGQKGAWYQIELGAGDATWAASRYLSPLE